MERAGSRHDGRFRDEEFAVFEEATPAARGLVEHVVRVVEQTKKSIDDLRTQVLVLAQALATSESAVAKGATGGGRKGHGPLLYADDGQQLLQDIDAILIELPAMNGVPNVEVVTDQLPGRDGQGMAKSTLRAKLITLGLVKPGEHTLKRFLVERKEKLDEQRFGATRMFSHLAAAVAVTVGCMGKIDLSEMPRMLLLLA